MKRPRLLAAIDRKAIECARRSTTSMVHARTNGGLDCKLCHADTTMDDRQRPSNRRSGELSELRHSGTTMSRRAATAENHITPHRIVRLYAPHMHVALNSPVRNGDAMLCPASLAAD
jgi:hypothetical protein